jgi:DNA helicase-2/ATP-dependent DNA helicase PcrA
MANKHKYSANEVSKAMGAGYDLTDEQVDAVENASVTEPALVVAGAGSGKTELMSVRVPWLVANGYALPQEILGLTFTRKAAAELSKRVFESLVKLRDLTDLWPRDLPVDFTPPTISTYNSYANGLFRDFALQLGYEADAIQLTDATQFQLARKFLFENAADIAPEILKLDFNPETLIKNVVEMSQTMTENLVTSEETTNYLTSVLEHLDALVKREGESIDAKAAKEAIELPEKLRRTKVVAVLAEAFLHFKLREGKIDYSDQVGLAERAVRELPQVAERERASFKQVLLDEYQDTSYLQTRLLAGLFKDHPVFAVGDPNQSIYGWRGASASNLSEFATDFSSKKIQQFKLSTSWRNPSGVLKLANHLASPLAQAPAYLSAEAAEIVSNLEIVTLRPAPAAEVGQVDIEFEQNLDDEAAAVAKWFSDRFAEPSRNEKGGQTAALLLSKRATMQKFIRALQDAGLEVEVVGIGGLLEMPEIADIRSALSVLVNPESGTELIRLLTGSRWRIGARDINELFKFAKKLNRPLKTKEQRLLADGQEETISIVDALDRFNDEKELASHNISEEGVERLKQAAKLFADMRKRIGLPLPELVRAIVAELWLDIELMANPSRRHPMIHINEFVSVVSNFAAGNSSASVSNLLDYLKFAEGREKLEAPRAKPQNRVVQVLTIHGAKGLEWDYVAIPRMVNGDLPTGPTPGVGYYGWMATGKLPYALRGDHRTLPGADLLAARSAAEVTTIVNEFKEGVKEMEGAEDRRVMYVAVTRPRHALLLSGSYWKPTAATKRPSAQKPSDYLIEVLDCADSPVDPNFELPAKQSDKPELLKSDEVEVWPRPIFGKKTAQRIEDAAKRVLAIDPKVIPATVDNSQTAELITRLLQERDVQNEQRKSVDFPVRIPASRFKEFLEDLGGVADSLLRPMPSQPFAQSRRGNLFHTWVEKKFAPTVSMFDDEDLKIEEVELDDAEDFFSIEELQANFDNSKYAAMTPIALEQEIQLTIGENTFICKMDAIYPDGDGVEIVDWKTNKPPTEKDDLYRRSLQLALYRLAYAEFNKMPIEKVKASFFFVGDNEIVSPELILGKAQILEAWSEVLEQVA